MNTFKDFLAEEAVTENEKLQQKLEKTRASMHNHWKDGGEARHKRGIELITRYEHLADKLKNNEGGIAHWRAYCKKHNYDHSHKGYDFYA